MFYTPDFERQPGDAPGVREADRGPLRLWASVFRQGLQDWAREKTPGEAARWFTSEHEGRGSFVWLCNLFEIHPERARAAAQARATMLRRVSGER